MPYVSNFVSNRHNMIKKIIMLWALAMTLSCDNSHPKSVISGNVSDISDDKIRINLPIDGKYFAGNYQEIPLSSQGTYSVEIPSITTGIVELTHHFTSAYLIANVQENYTIDFANKQVSYDTQSQKIFDLMHDLGLFTQARSVVDAEKYTDLNSKNQYYATLLKNGKERLLKARQELNLSERIYQKLNHLLELKIADYQSTDLFFTYRIFYEKDPNKNIEFVQTYIKTWEEIHLKAFENPEFSAYTGQMAFVSRYKMLLDIKQTGALQFSTEKPYFIAEIDFIRTHLPKHLVEFAWANTMYEGLQQGKFEYEWIANFDQFKTQFSESKLIDLLSPYIEKVKDFHQKDTDFEAHFVQDYQNINTLSELFSKYKGKVLYIDIWATWCVPCRKELQYSKENHHILEDMEVVSIYLSIDQDNAHQQWLSLVQNLKIEGVHIRANDILKNELSQFVTGIPHYMIIGKDGQIKEKIAKRPSDKNELFNQLKKYL